jgi:hypothetical protein
VEPFRFRNEEWTHYQVAPLRLPEMEHFVRDWYVARIANRSERDKNANDLVAILRNPKHTAIRELAENPLLLTIIALVHRIEADLPDERVLLYRKCTETLLATWHNYKYADTEGKKRGRVERRNLYRIEAIAHWMQCRDTKGNRERAIAPYEELIKFLTGYITKNEPEDPDHEPDQIAQQFLTFVKDRAGLLMEAGDQLYSFVHLTFQEYLTAEHVKRRSGQGGVDAVWDTLKGHCGDPRWHEVIRLLVAGYENRDAEARLVNELIRHDHESAFRRAPLIGGLLLDGVEAAEERQSQIVPVLVAGCVTAPDRAAFLPVWDILQEWTNRVEGNQTAVEAAIGQGGEPNRSLLMGLLGWTVPHGIPEIDWLIGSSTPMDDRAYVRRIRYTNKLRQLDWLGMSSTGGNFTRAIIEALFEWDLPDEIAQSVAYQMFMLLNTEVWMHYHFNSVLVAAETSTTRLVRSVAALHRAFDLRRYRRLDRDMALSNALDLDYEEPTQVEALASSRAGNWARARVRARARARARGLYPHPDLKMDRKSLWWQKFQTQPDLCGPLLDHLVSVLELKPKPLWWEFIRVRVLPTLPGRLRTYDRALWKRTTTRIESGTATDLDLWCAAHHLLTDSALWVAAVFKEPADSPARKLAQLTREIDFPALRIAHCLRDLAYGDESRTDDLADLVKSSDPEYQKFFRDAYWID